MAGPDDITSRLTVAGQAAGTDKPQFAAALAGSDLNHTEIQAVGGFASALQTLATSRLAQNSGAQGTYTAQETNHLDSLGESVPTGPDEDSRSFLEKALDKVAGVLSDTGGALLHNPVTDAVLGAGTFLGHVAQYPFRLLSDAVDSGNNDELAHDMAAQGYDPDSTASHLAFLWKHPENVYHNIDDIRNSYGDDLVDEIIKYQDDPEQYLKDAESLSDDERAKVEALHNSADWTKAADALDRAHISPGRDLARVLTLGHTDTKAFTFLSGTLDAAYTWFTDPTLIAFKGLNVAREISAVDASLTTASKLRPSTWAARGIDSVTGGRMRSGLLNKDGVIDMGGVEQLLRTEGGKAVTQVGKGWQRFLDDAKDLRAAHAKAQDTTLSAEERAKAGAERAGIYRKMSNRYNPLMGMLDEVNGSRKISEAAAGEPVDAIAGGGIAAAKQPIETLDDFRDYMTSTNGLMRLNTGWAAHRVPVMPGRLSKWAETHAAADSRTAKKTAKKAMTFDYTNFTKAMPHESEAAILDASAAAMGKAQYDLLRRHSALSITAARAKVDRISRRLTTSIPNVAKIDLNQANSPIVEQVARTYLNKGDAARLASAYALSDLGGRRQILKGVIEQIGHASGITRSGDGKLYMDKFLGELDDVGRQQYALGDADKIIDADKNIRRVAMHQTQLSDTVLIPSMKQMQYLAAKYAVGGFAQRTGISSARAFGQGEMADRLMGAIKLGWITSISGGLRNALDEIANFATYGIGREVLTARSAFTQATKDIRKERRVASKEYAQAVKRNGREAEDLARAKRAGEANHSYEEASRELEKAQSAQAELDNLGENLTRKVDAAHERLAQAKDFHFRALDEFDKGKTAGLTEAELAPLRTKAQATADERVRAETHLKERQKAAANPDAERAALEQRFADRGVLSVDEARASLLAAEKELKATRALESVIRYRVPRAFRFVADHTNDLLAGVVLGKAMRVFGKDFAVTPERVAIAKELADRELTQVIREGVFQSHYHDSGLMRASDEYAMDLHRSGLMARKYAFTRRYEGYGEIEPDGGAGLDAWAKMLHLAFSDETEPTHSWVQTVRALYSKDMSKADFDNMMTAARDSIRGRLEEEDLRHFVKNAEIFKQLRSGEKVGDSEVLKAKALDEYADRLSSHMTLMMVRDGKINQQLLDTLADAHATGFIPDSSWLANHIPGGERPEKVIGQLWAPFNPAHEPGERARGYTQFMSKGYDKIVTDQINALSRNPLLTALYFNAREHTKPYLQFLKDAGWSDEAATEVVKRMALQQAEAEALKHIDNPYVSSQFSLVNRNYATFVRAQEDWLRRWGRTARDNPQLIREGQLLIHGGETAGLVEQDDQGNLTFNYPNGLMNAVFGKLFELTGLPGGVSIPMVGELSSKLTFLNPSLDNPLALTATPLLSIPFKALMSVLPIDDKLLSASADQIVNGKLGAGREWWEQLLPSFASRIISGVISTEDPESKYGGWYAQALANLEAAGVLDDPRMQTATGKAALQHALHVGVRNAGVFAALFGSFAPAAPSLELGVKGKTAHTPGAAYGAGNKPDWSYHQIGIRSLKDEARLLVSKYGYDRALQLWTKMHPNELVYFDSARTQVNTPSASVTPSIAAARYIEQNPEFFSKYGGEGGVAAYFIPQGKPGTTDGEYSDVAYQAQLESGIRDYKSLSDYFTAIITQRGARDYYAAKDAYDLAKADAARRGDHEGADRLDAEWADQKDTIMQQNPLLAERFTQYAQDSAGQSNALEALQELARDYSPEANAALGANREGLDALLQAWSEYQEGAAPLADKRGRGAMRQKADLKATYAAAVAAIAGDANTTGQYPELADLARGVFRLPN